MAHARDQHRFVPGLPPTGRAIALDGADFVRIQGDTIRSVQGYFDSRAVPEQLGLDVVVQPKTAGPFAFGISTSVRGGNRAKPGAFGITALQIRSPEEQTKVRELSRGIAGEMLRMPGFIGWTGMTIGERMLTVTAWETPDGPRQLMRGGLHESAVRRFFSPEIGAGGWTSVWIPEHINALGVRCSSCARMVDVSNGARTCRCGASLPEPAPYW